ncbi:helix-turn-helix domain-containing protein [Dyella sp. 20L07]|uniref:helix-turn-helix domain-containing protein n=1 Tax=Dyella sp. 20L07 TaxID=3384240 RepID=UPI003D2CF5D1
MAILVSPSVRESGELLPSGQLWLPRASLVACVRSVVIRSTLGYSLDDERRINRFPATPLCSLSWWFDGSSELLVAEHQNAMPGLDSSRLPAPGRWVLGGPQTRPTSTWCPGPVHGMMVMLMPDALHLLTGLEPTALTDRLVDATNVLPPDWLAMCAAVQREPDDAKRVAHLEDFLEPRWQACRPPMPLARQRHADWAIYLTQYAATSAVGRSLRQLERRIKRWAGLPLRELRGFGRAERAFFEAVAADVAQSDVKWVDVAAAAGYADQSHLSRVTRRITGYAPQALYEGMQRHEAFWMYRLWATS